MLYNTNLPSYLQYTLLSWVPRVFIFFYHTTGGSKSNCISSAEPPTSDWVFWGRCVHHLLAPTSHAVDSPGTHVG